MSYVLYLDILIHCYTATSVRSLTVKNGPDRGPPISARLHFGPSPSTSPGEIKRRRLTGGWWNNAIPKHAAHSSSRNLRPLLLRGPLQTQRDYAPSYANRRWFSAVVSRYKPTVSRHHLFVSSLSVPSFFPFSCVYFSLHLEKVLFPHPPRLMSVHGGLS